MRSLFFTLIRFTGVPWLARELFQRRKTTIILYHDPDPVSFDRHLAFFSRRYNVIKLQQFLDARRKAETGKLPRKALIITIDDGHKGNHRLLPVIKKYGVVPTIFLTSGVVGTTRRFWWTAVPDPEHKRRLKGMPDADRLRELERLGFHEETESDDRQALSAEEITEMRPYVDFQSHTVFHPCLPRCSTERVGIEIEASKDQLRQRLGIESCALSYPNGDHSPQVRKITRDTGYECGITLDPGFNDGRTDLFALKRISMLDGSSLSEAVVKASGLWAVGRGCMERLKLRR
jgi:poly-beta-1,6-N-acetyl-D-glucosamine N-deacetylase